MLARGQLAQGDLAAALAWVCERKLSVDDDLNYLREFEHITLARVLRAHRTTKTGESASSDVMRFLDRLQLAAEEGGRFGSVIEILALQALEFQTLQELPAALEALARAVALAEPEGYARVFLDEGPDMVTLLRALEKTGVVRNYVHRLLSASAPRAQRPPSPQGLIEPLSERELEVLRLLGTDLDGPEIARHLVVSLSTVRTHTKNIYAKLGVNNRRAAVRRADELDLRPKARD